MWRAPYRGGARCERSDLCPVRDTLLRAAAVDLYQPYWSSDLLDEVSRNLLRDRPVSAAQVSHLINELRRSFPEAEVTNYRRLIGSMTNHPKDRHVAAAAVKVSAQVIVTFNLKDFPSESLAPYAVEGKHPDAFLCDNLFGLYPGILAQIVIDQTASLTRPPMNVQDLLTILERHVPQFAANVRLFLVEQRRNE